VDFRSSEVYIDHSTNCYIFFTQDMIPFISSKKLNSSMKNFTLQLFDYCEGVNLSSRFPWGFNWRNKLSRLLLKSRIFFPTHQVARRANWDAFLLWMVVCLSIARYLLLHESLNYTVPPLLFSKKSKSGSAREEQEYTMLSWRSTTLSRQEIPTLAMSCKYYMSLITHQWCIK
jgi:hypothetical protein